MLFAVERYDASGTGACPDVSFPDLPLGLRLSAALHLPADEAVLALIEGPDESSVGAAMLAAGWRFDRISPARWLTPVATGSIASVGSTELEVTP